jgi:cytochrome c5
VHKPPVAHAEKLKCEVAGIWKSNFEKIYQFAQGASGMLSGKQFEGDILIDKMDQKDDKVIMEFRFKGEKGRSELQLTCKENLINMQGRFRLPNRTGDWIFTKMQNAKAASSGQDLFAANCTICHFSDRKDTKVGPGLLGLFKNPKLPKSGRVTNEENVRETIVNGREKMPPFKHLKDQEIQAIINYLKSL